MKDTFRHATCGSTTTMRSAVAAAYERDPERFELGVFCDGCGQLVPSFECLWCDVEVGGVSVTDERLAPLPDASPEPEPEEPST